MSWIEIVNCCLHAASFMFSLFFFSFLFFSFCWNCNFTYDRKLLCAVFFTFPLGNSSFRRRRFGFVCCVCTVCCAVLWHQQKRSLRSEWKFHFCFSCWAALVQWVSRECILYNVRWMGLRGICIDSSRSLPFAPLSTLTVMSWIDYDEWESSLILPGEDQDASNRALNVGSIYTSKLWLWWWRITIHIRTWYVRFTFIPFHFINNKKTNSI